MSPCLYHRHITLCLFSFLCVLGVKGLVLRRAKAVESDRAVHATVQAGHHHAVTALTAPEAALDISRRTGLGRE